MVIYYGRNDLWIAERSTEPCDVKTYNEVS